MRTGSTQRRRCGFVPLEIMAVVAVMAVLLGLGVIVVRGARRHAHLAEAESRLRQVSVSLDLYYNKYGRYPASGKYLPRELEEFVGNKTIFENPLNNESASGMTVSSMYQEPVGENADSPEAYMTSFLSPDGKTAVILKTDGKIVTTTRLSYNPTGEEEYYTDAKIDVITLIEEENGANEDVEGIHPILAIFVKYGEEVEEVVTESTDDVAGNKGHGNNEDHDDSDNPAEGDGDHGTEDGFVRDPDELYDADELRGAVLFDVDAVKGRAYTTRESSLTIGIANTTRAPHDAVGVCVDVTVQGGEQYLKRLNYVREVGDIPAGESRPFFFDYTTTHVWTDAGPDAYIRFCITITAEGNDPGENVGEKVDVLFIK